MHARMSSRTCLGCVYVGVVNRRQLAEVGSCLLSCFADPTFFIQKIKMKVRRMDRGDSVAECSLCLACLSPSLPSPGEEEERRRELGLIFTTRNLSSRAA